MSKRMNMHRIRQVVRTSIRSVDQICRKRMHTACVTALNIWFFVVCVCVCVCVCVPVPAEEVCRPVVPRKRSGLWS